MGSTKTKDGFRGSVFWVQNGCRSRPPEILLEILILKTLMSGINIVRLLKEIQKFRPIPTDLTKTKDGYRGPIFLEHKFGIILFDDIANNVK